MYPPVGSTGTLWEELLKDHVEEDTAELCDQTDELLLEEPG